MIILRSRWRDDHPMITLQSRWRDDRPTRGRLDERVALLLVGHDTLLGTIRI